MICCVVCTQNAPRPTRRPLSKSPNQHLVIAQPQQQTVLTRNQRGFRANPVTQHPGGNLDSDCLRNLTSTDQARNSLNTDTQKAATLVEGRGFRCRGWLVGEFGDCLGPEEVLVGAQIAHSLDVERVLKVLGIARAHTLERQRGRQRAH